MLEYELDASSLVALQQRARQQDTTVQGALGAAQLLAIAEQFPDLRPHRLGLTSLADLRGSLSGGLTERDLALYITTLWTVHTVRVTAQFWELAREIREGLAAWLSAGEGNLINGVYPGSPAARPINSAARLMQSIIALAPSSSMLTNFGRVDPVELGDGLHVKSLAFIVTPPVHHPIAVTAISYGGKLVLYLLHDELRLSNATARMIGDAMMAQLQHASASV